MAGYWASVTDKRLRRRRLLQGGASFSVGAAALALLGCSSDDDGDSGGSGGSSDGGSPTATAGAGSPTAAEPKRGGSYGYVSGSTAGNLNPVDTWAEGHQLSGVNVYDRFLSSRLSRDWVLEAAASVETPDSTQVVVKLKDGLTFHDIDPVNGRAVTSADIVAAQEYVKDSPKAENDFQRNVTASIETPDDNTIVFHLSRPNAYLFSSGLMGHPGSMAIIPAEILDDLDTHTPIGSGPFFADDYTVGAEYHYKRFDRFREEGLPYLDEKVAIHLTDQVALETAFRGQRVLDWIPNPGVAERILKEVGSRIELDNWLAPNPYTFNLCMKEGLPWTDDARAREAFYRLMDRQQIVDLVFLGKAEVPTGVLSLAYDKYKLDSSETEEYFRNDVAEAKKLLEASNFPLDQQFELMTGQASISAQMAEILFQQFEPAGLKIRPQAYPTAEFLQKSQAGDWHMFTGGHPAYEVNIPIRQAGHHDSRSQFAYTGLSDPEVEALVEKSEETLDEDEQVKLVKQLQIELLKRYAGYYLILTRTIDQVRWAKLKNFEIDPGYSNAGLMRYDLWIDA